MIIARHSIRRVREQLVARFRFNGDPRAWLIVAKVTEEPSPDRSGTWLHSRPMRRIRRPAWKPA
jgi:hypothetical protein